MTLTNTNGETALSLKTGSESSWKWDGRYPVRCKIIDVTGHEVFPGIEGRTPDESKPHVGKTGTARRVRLGMVEITLDDGGTLMGYECWWAPIPNGAYQPRGDKTHE